MLTQNNGTTGVRSKFLSLRKVRKLLSNGLCLGRLWCSVQRYDLLERTLVGTNLSGDQPAYNAKIEDFLSERIATAPLLGLDRVEGSRSDYSWSRLLASLGMQRKAWLDLCDNSKSYTIVGHRLLISTTSQFGLRMGRNILEEANFLDCAESAYYLLIQRCMPLFDVISRQHSITLSLLRR
jgi:hypothetical protein